MKKSSSKLLITSLLSLSLLLLPTQKSFASIDLVEIMPNDNPNKFIFIDKINVDLDTQITSNEILVTGINSLSPISIEGGEYSINGGPYTEDLNLVSNEDSIVVRIKSSPIFSTKSSATLKIGNVSDDFSVTTIPLDSMFNQATFFAITDIF